MTGRAPRLRFDEVGAECFAGAALGSIEAIHAALASLGHARPGVRLHGLPALAAQLSHEAVIGRLASSLLGGEARQVHAILFDKSAGANWALGWHQDRTIAVRARRAVPGFGPWTRKSGLHHVEPPFALLARMATLRIHLDPVPQDNAPLLIAPDSHRTRVSEAEISTIVAGHGVVTCLAEADDVWAYATPILHASNAAEKPARRRVLQVDYSADSLPGGLEWLGI